ncbi:hypothetical protein [Actinophytocola gossypii]|uniref:ABC transporter permease n=1 Tax=Actinophytocola gossypii TaxID=2812003 RepID=A0ABT2JCQ7_9PSEU|nr:hypothetical protein [Actinophytocola gossypii]MCT2585658.1 hypothetical protein [Actinophytocola gossypii]
MTAPPAEELVAPPPTEPARLHRPARAAVALAELLAAAGLVAAAVWWAWPNGFATIVTVARDGTELTSERTSGNWLAAAIGLGALAALLLVDAVRQVVLAVRTRPRPRRSAKVARG